MRELVLSVPRKIARVLASNASYKILYGGRGSAKSWSVARYIIARAYAKKCDILCGREIQNSIKDSVHRIIKNQIDELNLNKAFTVTRENIRCFNGSEIIFKGFKHNIDSIKSIEGIDICWIEEAQSLSQESIETIIPTIRKEESVIIITFNPKEENAPVYKRFVLDPPEDAAIAKVNFCDNPFFTDKMRREMEYKKRTDYEQYLHVWEGELLKISDAVVFNKKYRVSAFETPANANFYHGVDWGFSQDPTAAVRAFESDDRRTLYVDAEAYGVGVELNELAQFFDNTIPTLREWTSYADSARPDIISHLRNYNFFRIKACDKWPGSIESGITYLRSYDEIVIHERCKHIIDEFSFYKYKVDKITGDVQPIVLDKNNHCIDALRYAMNQQIKTKKSTLFG